MAKNKETDAPQKTSTRKSLFDNNKFVFVLSLVFAIALWITISPERSKTIQDITVNINTENTAPGNLGLDVISGQGQTVSVEVTGKWYVISELTQDDIAINYSLSDVTEAGTHEVQLTASKNSTLTDYEITRITPSSLVIGFDRVTSKQFKVVPDAQELVDHCAEGLFIDNGRVFVEQAFSNVEITGSATIIENIASVSASVEVDTSAADFEPLTHMTSYTTPLKLYDAQGSLMYYTRDGQLYDTEDQPVDASTLSLSFWEVEVTVPVYKTEVLTITPEFENVPDYYLTNPIDYKLSKSTIKVNRSIGTPEDLENFDATKAATIGPIDFTTIGENYQETFDIVFSDNSITPVDDDTKVTITIAGLSSTQVDVSNFRAVNGSTAITTRLVTTTKTVTVVGPSDVIEDINGEYLYLEYDLSTLSANASGNVVISATLKSDQYKTIWGYGNYDLQITVTRNS